MQEFVLGPNEAGQRLDKYLAKVMPLAPKSFFYKMMRKKNIVLNGKKVEGKEITAVGDHVKCFLSDETIAGFRGKEKTVKTVPGTPLPKLSVVYEDEDIVIADKPVGVLSQKAEAKDVSMVEMLMAHLLDNGSLTQEQLQTFQPSVANRLDRNTSGLILAGKSLGGSQQLAEMLRERTLTKEYLTIVKGTLREKILLDGYLTKDEKTNQVRITTEPTGDPDEARIYTEIKPWMSQHNATVLIVHLITGKPHQIRAHLASIGHPIFGDTKYGQADINRRLRDMYGLKNQLLHAWRVRFCEPKGCLERLTGKAFVAEVPAMFAKIVKGEGLWLPGPDEDYADPI